MVSSLDTAFGEITLVLFTTLAPSGVAAFIIMLGALIRSKQAKAARAHLAKYLSIPLVVSMVGLVASATHLGNPSNALYVFMGVGRSPLSNEVFGAVVFLAFAGVYWLYSFSEKPLVRIQQVWEILTVVAGAVFITTIAFAYFEPTITSWSTPFIPVALWLNALVGGPVLALLGFRAAQYEGLSGTLAKRLIFVSFVALVLNVFTYALQAAQLPSLTNSFGTAADLVPYYPLMILAFSLFNLGGMALVGVLVFKRGQVSFARALGACILVYMGIFIMRFAFYMMHMTAGLGV